MDMALSKVIPNETVKRLRQLLDGSHNILITCHVRPDGDAIGSSFGWYHTLKAMGKDVNVILPDRMPKSLEFLPSTKDAVIYTQHKDYADRLMSEADLVLCCDFNAWSRLGNLGTAMSESPAAKVLIDHHQKPQIDVALLISYPDMSSTCELAFRLICDLGWYLDMPRDAAQCLLTGLITDTQNFTVNCNNPEIYQIMIKLMEKGVDKSEILWEAVKLTTYSAMKLNAFAIAERMEIFPKYRGALISLTKEDLERFDYQKGDTEGLVNEPLRVRGLVYSIFLREDDDCIKVSMRSRYDYPVSDMCEDLGGGGHRMAAGAEFTGTMEECRMAILAEMEKYARLVPPNIDKLELK